MRGRRSCKSRDERLVDLQKAVNRSGFTPAEASTLILEWGGYPGVVPVASRTEKAVAGTPPQDAYEKLMSCGHAKRYAYGRTPCSSAINCALCDLAASRASGTAPEHILRNLLAVIHRDGGHYANEHGLQKAGEDAEKIVLELRAVSGTEGSEALKRIATSLKLKKTMMPLGELEAEILAQADEALAASRSGEME